MAVEYFVMSNFGTRYFLLPYTDSDSVPASAKVEDEITSVISSTIGQFTKENTKYRTLNGNGWESIAPLGNSSEDAEFSCLREGIGGVFDGAGTGSTYAKIKAWMMQATKGAGVASPRCIVEVLPRGNNQYEGTCYYVVPAQWMPGQKDTETGQEYQFSVSLFGPQNICSVVYTPAQNETPESWAFTKKEVVDNPSGGAGVGG